MNTSEPTSFKHRLSVACQRAACRYAERGGFISDDDLLDIANDLTVSDLSIPDDGTDHWLDDRDTADRDALIEGLHVWLTPAEPDEFVWVVRHGHDYEGDDVRGVYADKGAAERAIATHYPRFGVHSTHPDGSVHMRSYADRYGGYLSLERFKVGEWE